MSSILLLVLLMAAVTFIPRLIPLVFIRVDNVPKKLRIFLSYIPYAVLGALIIPGGVFGIPNSPWISIIVLAAAALISWIKNSIIITFILCVALAWGLQTLLPYL